VQRQILDNAWTLLKPGGRLLYATCSVLPQENSDQIVRFVDMHPDASLITLDNDWGMACNAGRQLFPARDGHDGFYYALLQKAD
ncbi:MAG: 16S rRNA (cytosine(967)-C(5))-methyltransferase, partial [Thalassolituus sp.]